MFWSGKSTAREREIRARVRRELDALDRYKRTKAGRSAEVKAAMAETDTEYDADMAGALADKNPDHAEWIATHYVKVVEAHARLVAIDAGLRPRRG